MSARLAESKAKSEELLGRFKAIAPRSAQEIIQSVYELGVAYGNLEGKVECAKLFTKEAP